MASPKLFLQLALLLAAVVVRSSPIQPRAVIPNSQIVGLPEAVPAGIVGDLYEAYQPFLDVYNGCVPSPAVDANGNTK